GGILWVRYGGRPNRRAPTRFQSVPTYSNTQMSYWPRSYMRLHTRSFMKIVLRASDMRQVAAQTDTTTAKSLETCAGNWVCNACFGTKGMDGQSRNGPKAASLIVTMAS